MAKLREMIDAQARRDVDDYSAKLRGQAEGIKKARKKIRKKKR